MIASVLSIAIPATVTVVVIDYLVFRWSRRNMESWIDRIEREIVK